MMTCCALLTKTATMLTTLSARGLRLKRVQDDDEEDSEPMVTHATPKHSVQLLQCYSVKQGFSDNTHAPLDARADLIYSIAYASRPL